MGKVLFHDDFANTSSGWVTSDLGSIQFAYEGGEYLIAPKKGDLNSHALLPNRQFDNISVQVDARFVSGSADSIFGLICRATAGTVLEKAYEFLITPDGGYGILKIAGPGAGESKLLGQEGKSNAIRRGNATNQLRADCSASNLALYVNGQKLLAAQDSDFKMGQVGFAISTPSKSNGFEARFDNFVVRDAAP